MAQIASAFPTAGGLYHWSAILGGRGWGWAAAWFNLGGLIFVTAAVNGANGRDWAQKLYSRTLRNHILRAVQAYSVIALPLLCNAVC